MDARKREDERRQSASTAGLEAAERARLRAMTSIERMTRALEMGAMLRQLAKAKSTELAAVRAAGHEAGLEPLLDRVLARR